jgi:hypothetical protein
MFSGGSLRRFPLLRVISICFGLLILHLVGIFVREKYGIAVSIHNSSGQVLQRMTVTSQPRGEKHDLGSLANEKRTRVFVQPAEESHLVLEFMDNTGPHQETIVGYVESGYCGKAEIDVVPGGKVVSSEKIEPVACMGGWLDFL